MKEHAGFVILSKTFYTHSSPISIYRLQFGQNFRASETPERNDIQLPKWGSIQVVLVLTKLCNLIIRGPVTLPHYLPTTWELL